MANHRVFVSYARTDALFARKLASDLKAKGVDIWLDTRDIPVGSKWDDEIEKAIDDCDCLLVIISPTSAVSDNVLNEISSALDDGKRVLPVKIAECRFPLRIKRLQYVDMSLDYNEGLSALAETLMPDDSIPSSIAHDPAIADANERAVKEAISNWEQKANNSVEKEKNAPLNHDIAGKQSDEHQEAINKQGAAGRMEQFAPTGVPAGSVNQGSKSGRRNVVLFVGLGGLVAIAATVLAINSGRNPEKPDNLNTQKNDSAIVRSAVQATQPNSTHLAGGSQNSDIKDIDGGDNLVQSASVKEPTHKAPRLAPKSHSEATTQNGAVAKTPASADIDNEGDAENASGDISVLKSKVRAAAKSRHERIDEIKGMNLSRSEKKKLIREENRKLDDAKKDLKTAKAEVKEDNNRKRRMKRESSR
jgi:hypothetical protein